MRFFVIIFFCFSSLGLAQVHHIMPSAPRRSIVGADTVLAISVSPASVNFLLVPGGVASANTPISITSSLQQVALTNVNVYAWLPSSTAALSSAGGASIPASCVLGQVPTGVPTSFTPFAQSSPFGPAGASLKVVGIKNVVSSHIETDNLYLQIDLTSLPQQPAGNYVGYVYIEAQAL